MYLRVRLVEIERKARWMQGKGTGMSLMKREAIRMAAALEDYDLLNVTGVEGTEDPGYSVTVVDERFDLQYEIASHFDYWDFLGYFLSHAQYPAAAGAAIIQVA